MATTDSYFKNRSRHFFNNQDLQIKPESSAVSADIPEYIYQCNHCKTWMDNDIPKGVLWDYTCSVCNAPGSEFTRINKKELIESFN